jgi:hypothetical protein
MPLDALVGYCLLASAVYCALKVRDANRELRRRMTPRIELPRHPRRDPERSGLEDLGERLEESTHRLFAIDQAIVRPEWRRESHTGDGAALVTRFWRLVAVTGVLGVTGWLLIASAMQ